MRKNLVLTFCLSILSITSIVSQLYSQVDFWIKTNATPTGICNGIVVNDTGHIFVATTTGLYRSKDYGSTWTFLNTATPPDWAGEIRLNSRGDIFLKKYLVYRSTDNGSNWFCCNSGWPSNESPLSITVTPSGTILASTNPGVGIYKSTNNGDSWIPTNLTNAVVYCFASDKNGHIYAGPFQDGIYRSDDDGSTWTQMSLGFPKQTAVLAMTVAPNQHIYCRVNYYINNQPYFAFYRSTNSGNSWIMMADSCMQAQDLIVTSSGVIYGATYEGGVYRSTDNGTSWAQFNSGLSDLRTVAFALNPDGFLYLATYSGVYHSVSPVTSVNTFDALGPVTYSLEQNYPNPFNPSTNISFNLPRSSFVSLKVFDLLGREVASIISEEMQAGRYSHKWNAASLPSGVYFYRLQAGLFTETKKLVLLR
jgi:photosystem II stability/assembly factor-like uncharacterized protein